MGACLPIIGLTVTGLLAVWAALWLGALLFAVVSEWMEGR